MKAIRRFERLIGMGPWWGPRCLAIFFALSMLPVTGSARAEYTVGTGTNITVTVSCSNNELNLTGINASGIEYLNGNNNPLLSFSVDPNDPTNYNNGDFSDSLSSLSCVMNGSTLQITANYENLFNFFITLSPDTTNSAVIVTTQVMYQGPNATALFRTMLPNVQINVPNSSSDTWMAMVPWMIGTVVPLSQVNSSGLGAPYNSDSVAEGSPAFGLPTSFNVMQIAEVYDLPSPTNPASSKCPNGCGLFFTDLDGDYGQNIAPLQFNLTNAGTVASPIAGIAGYWTALLKFNQTMTLPRLAIGVHTSGDWHNAVDYYMSQRSWLFTFPNSPSWFSEAKAGGIYSLGIAGGGSFIGIISGQWLSFPDAVINDNYFGIELFACNSTITVNGMTKTTGTPPNQPGQRCLLDVLNDAQSLGSSVIYLTGWWNGGYTNKGDYTVDTDLGGETGLATAVQQVHNAGGYVILYMEPYLAAPASNLVTSGPGNSWQALPGPPIPPPPDYFTNPYAGAPEICMYGADCMAMPNAQWQDYLIDVAQGLVSTANVDGFFLDSWGWQMNWPVRTSSENVDYTSQQWSAVALRFVDRFRAAIQAKNPNAIVLGENNVGELPFHWDGGSAADLAWGPTLYNGLLWASPVRYAMPQTNFFVNGLDLGSVNQAFASGHNLALGPFWLTDVMDAPYFASNGLYGVVATTTLTTDGSKKATVSSSANLSPGQYVSAASVPFGSTIVKIEDNTLTLSQKATATASVSAEFSTIRLPAKDTTVSNYIQQLMNIRKNYADALVNGNQLPMPVTSPGAPDIVAFMYQGTNDQVLAIVNNSGAEQTSVSVTPNAACGTTIPWASLLPWGFEDSPPAHITEAPDGTMLLSNLSPAPSATNPAMGGLVILQRSCSSPAPIPPGVTQEVPLMNESFFYGMSNWTDWMASGDAAVPSNNWSDSTSQGLLYVSSMTVRSLLFYDSFGASDFTYSGEITFDSFGPATSGEAEAGLSFRLSDNPQTGCVMVGKECITLPPELDAGNQGYDAILTNQSSNTCPSGAVLLFKRPRGSNAVGSLGCLNVSFGQTYLLSVTATTTYTTATATVNSYPLSTTFTVSVDGNLMITYVDTDTAGPFSGRFGVNSSNADAHFACLQATAPNDPPLPACPKSPPLPVIPHPPVPPWEQQYGPKTGSGPFSTDAGSFA